VTHSLLTHTAYSTRLGSLALIGTTTSFADLSISERQQVLQGWRDARLPLFRKLFRSLAALLTQTWVRLSPTLGNVLAYPRVPLNHNFGEGFPFKFLQFPPSDTPVKASPETIETDIVLVGSGCTGAVAASMLADAGLSVLVVDKSYYYSPKHLPMSEVDAARNLFANGGVTCSDDGLMNLVAGSCWGGGGTVNWSASLHLQGYVREAWRASSGIPYFTSAAFQNDMDAVCEVMGVGTQYIEHNFGNKQLLEGARKLGMNGKAVPQNTGGAAHSCGYCTLGCGSCGKKGPTETWLPNAARKGAQFIEGFEVEEVIYEGKDAAGNRKATGVRGLWTSRDSNSGTSGTDRYTRPVVIKAKHGVVISAGAMHTPLLLKRSGITNPHVGRHLHLHPVSFCGAKFDQDTHPWDGSILTSVVNDFENQDGQGHGVKMEATTMIPGLWIPFYASFWEDALKWKTFAAEMRNSCGYISLARDEGEGRVYPDPADKSQKRMMYSYKVSKKDKKHIAKGLLAFAKILYVQGAREIFVSVPGIPSFVRTEQQTTNDDGVNNADFQAWLTHLERLVEVGHPAEAQYASAHQMGSARMGSSKYTSAVDPNGQVWGTNGLYVVDTSVFPQASGVNPMVTGMGVARGLARGIAERATTGKDTGRAKL